jgi:hypothetical protein
MSKRISKFVLLIASASIALAPVFLGAESMYSGGPPDGRTGAPEENLCLGCHSTYDPNSGDGSLQIIVPDEVMAGQPTTITVVLEDPGQLRWGFEMTVINSVWDGVGAFTITDAVNTQLSDNAEPVRDYVKHTSTGTYAGTADGPVQWSVEYTPSSDFPAESFFDVYVAGNAANNDGSSDGDYIYTANKRVNITAAVGVPSSSLVGLLILTVLLILTAFYILTRRRFAH